MDLGIDKTKITQYKALLEKHLSDPIKLRLTTMGGLLVLSVGLIYLPLSSKIDNNKKLFMEEKRRNNYITDCEKLTKQAATFHSRIGEKADINSWVQYLLDGMRNFHIKLRSMQVEQPKEMKPYQAAGFSMEIEGKYPELRSYVEWLESSPRLIRIDSLQFEKGADNLLMRIVVLGVLPKK